MPEQDVNAPRRRSRRRRSRRAEGRRVALQKGRGKAPNKEKRVVQRAAAGAPLVALPYCHGGHINLYYQNVIPSPYTKWYHKSCYIIVWVLMEIVYSIFIGMISSKIVGMINGIGLQCRRDSHH